MTLAVMDDQDLEVPDYGWVKPVVEKLINTLTTQQNKCDSVDSWLKPDPVWGFPIPARATREHEQLAGLSRTPWLSLVVTNVAQAMYVDNIVTNKGESKDLWDLWVDNDVPSRQIANHRAMLSYGLSFAVITPAEHRGVQSARIRFVSPRRLACKWDDDASDPYPVYALEALDADDRSRTWRLFTETHVLDVTDDKAGHFTVTNEWEHGGGQCPVVRFANDLDLDGNTVGEVVPFIPTAARINKTAYDRLLAQHFNSWKVRTISGIDLPEDADPDTEATKVAETKMRLSQEDILVAEDPDARFGTLDGTSLDTYVKAWTSDIEALAAVSQTPAHALTGQLVNLNAEALAAARAPLTQKVWERQVSCGVSYARTLRMAATFAGLDELADDPMVRTTWQDMEIRSMSQAVDALGKAASMLKIPSRGLWARIPGVERSDIQEWDRLAREEENAQPLTRLMRHTDPTTADDGTDAPAAAE